MFGLKNIYKEIDSLIKSYESEHIFIEHIKNQFDTVLKGLQKKKSNEANFVKINSTSSEGYFISMSKIRYENLEKYYKKTNEDILLGESKIKFNELEIKDLKSLLKIMLAEILVI